MQKKFYFRKFTRDFCTEKTEVGLLVSLMNFLPLAKYKIKICWAFQIQIIQRSSMQSNTLLPLLQVFNLANTDTAKKHLMQEFLNKYISYT